MSAVAVKATDLGKSYRIYHDGDKARYRTLRESLVSTVSRPLRGTTRESETLWALRDLSFEVQRGEAVGIIGRNGAGKSTLLKLLSRITRPTEGFADVYGNIGSLLEVGTGMHPELTGRENIFLNGAILGMGRGEIRRRFDEIVDFAEIGRFLDTPVKRYSTGMHTRLAFSVAAHLDTDILVVDEVLAVGDRVFQQKCLGKMESVAGEGRTVLFVSHNMAAVSQLCQRAYLLDHGELVLTGDADSVVARYMAGGAAQARADLQREDEIAGDRPRFTWAEVRDSIGNMRDEFSIGDAITIALGLVWPISAPNVKLAISIRASEGLPIAHVVDQDSAFELRREPSSSTLSVTFDDIRLYPDTYYVTLWASDTASTDVFDHAEDVMSFTILDGGHLTMRSLPRHSGVLFMTPRWEQSGETYAAPETSPVETVSSRGL